MQRQTGHLVSGLGARRNKPAFRACAGGAVTNGVNVRVAGGLQRWLYHQLVDAVCFQAANLFHEIRRLDTCRPDHQIGFDVFAIFGVQAMLIGTGDHGLSQDTHAHLGQLVVSSARDTWRQRRQNTLARFHQGHVQGVVS